MTEKIARRGARVVSEYVADLLEQILVRDVASAPVVVLRADDPVERVAGWISRHASGYSHQGFPVVDEDDRVVGVVTRRDFHDVARANIRDIVKRPPVVVFEDSTLRDAAEHMVREGVGRLPVVARDDPQRVIGIITRSDGLASHGRTLDAERVGEAKYKLFGAQRSTPPAPPEVPLGSRSD
jgi:CBS domain-containing protein